MRFRPHLIFDLETVRDDSIRWSPPEPESFPPTPLHRIVAFGALAWDSHGPRWLRCLGGKLDGNDYERRALVEFASLLEQHQPTLVSWNGRGFDMAVVVARALKHRVPMPTFWMESNYQKRFTAVRHCDLADQLAQTGAARNYSLDQASQLIGRDGKGEVSGEDVAQLWGEMNLKAIHDYVLSDVVETAHVWLRWEEQRGRITEEQVNEAVEMLDELVVATKREAA